MSFYIVLLGPPGAGKGTQAQIISQNMGLPHISSGDIFREHLKSKTELGNLAKEYIDSGKLVPDKVTISMIRERISRKDCQDGALLDGFPRTTAQAEALSSMLADFNARVNAVPYINVPEKVLIERLTGRWTCRAQGHVFHEKFNPPKLAGLCDFDDSELYQRDDDKVETVVNRIQVYFKQTIPLINYYRHEGLLIEIDGIQPIEKVSADLLRALAALSAIN
jgi:adenylate kinase